MPSATVERLLGAVLALAEAQGMDGQTLAQRSGLRQETISRVKKRGTADVDTVAKLAGAVGKRLDLVDNQPLIEKLRNKSLLDQ